MPGISERELLKLLEAGYESPMIHYRLLYAEADSILKYLHPLVGLIRAHPHFMPTQKSGRWSTKNPPLPNFSADCINPECPRIGVPHRAGAVCWSLRDIVVPDPGFYFLKFDWQAIEAKLAAAYSGDEEDLALFAADADIHVATMCKMYGFPLPPDLMDPHTSSVCENWRQTLGWDGKDDWRRIASKTSRFSLAYAADERGIHQAKDVDKLARLAGLDKAGLEAMAKAYLDSKPKLIAWKRSVWDHIVKKCEVRTPLGRRKRLFVSDEEYLQYKRTGRATHSCKEGLNHLAQGQVADMMNLTIIAIKARWPLSRFGFQSHDGLLTVWPESVDPWPAIREVVECEWSVGEGRSIRSTADWVRVYADHTMEVLK